MKTPTARLTTAGLVLAWTAGSMPAALGDPPTCSIEVGKYVDEVLVWYTNEDNEFEVARDGRLRVTAEVGQWVTVLGDAWVLPPDQDPLPQDYLELVDTYPFLKQAVPDNPDPLLYGPLPVLYVEQHLFEDTIDAVFDDTLTGAPLASTVRSFLQPVMGAAPGPALRPIVGDPPTWIEDGSTDQLELWKYRAVRRELTEDPVTPNDIDHFSFEAFWQSVLTEKHTEASTFFNDRGAYEAAIEYGLQLTLQPIVLHSSANDSSDYTPPSQEEDVPGLEGIGGSAVSIGIGQPIVFGVRAQDGSGRPTIDENGPILASPQGTVTMFTSMAPHKNAAVLVEVMGDERFCPLKFVGTHRTRFDLPGDIPIGTGSILMIVNTWSYQAYAPGEIPLHVSPFGQ